MLLSLVGGFVRPAEAAPVVATDTQQSGAGFGFGRNDFGQVKPGTTANQLSSVQLPGTGGSSLTDAVSITAGNGFTVWADHNGKVWSIGDNSNGQAGNGSTSGPITVPTQAVGFGGSGQPKAVKVVSYGLAVEVLDDSGSVWQWGQVANSSTTLTIQKTPAKLSFPTGTGRIIDIAAGNQFALAMDTAYKPYAWGKNDRGQLGTNSNNTATAPTALYKPPALGPNQTAMIEAGKDFGIYVVSGPTGVDLYTWGAGNAYQLGNGKTTDSKLAAKAASFPAPLGGSLTALSVSGGGSHGMLLTSDKVVRTWGSNGVAVNQTPTVVSSSLFTGNRVPYLVSAGDGSSFVASTDMVTVPAPSTVIAAWGTDTTGQLGRGSTGTQLTPTAITIPGSTPPTLTGPPVQIVSRQGATYSIVDAEIATTPDRAGFDFGSFPTSPVQSQVAPAHTFTLNNVATKTLNVTSFGVEGTNAADFVASGTPCTTMNVDSSCSITITFRPKNPGARKATLALRTSNTLGGGQLSYVVPLLGNAYASVQGLANYTLKVGAGTPSTLPGRGNRISIGNIDPALIPEVVPQRDSATLGKTGLPTLGKITLGKTTLGKTTLGKTTLGKTGLPTLGKIGLPTLGKITLGKTTLGKTPLLSEGGWVEFVKDYPGLANMPVSSITFDELFAQPAHDDVAAPADRITLDRIDLANSILAQASFLSLLMGTTKLSQYPIQLLTVPGTPTWDWCTDLRRFSPAEQCTGSAMDRTLFDLSLTYGYPIDELRATDLTLGQLTPEAGSSDPWANTVWSQILLDSIKSNLVGTHLNLPLTSIPTANLQAVLDCSQPGVCTNLAGRRLSDVAAAIRPTAAIGDLGPALNSLKVAWVAEPFIDRSDFPWEQLPRTAIPLSAYPNKVLLQADVDLNCLQAADTHFGFDLPAGYDYVPDSATLTPTRGTDGVSLVATTNGQHVDVAVPDSVFSSTGAISCTNDSGHLQVNIKTLPPDTPSSSQKATGTVATGGLSASGVQNTGISTTGVYDPPSSSPDSTTTIQPDELLLGHLDPGHTQFANVDVASDRALEVTLSGIQQDSDLDLTAYHPKGAALDPVLSGNTNPLPVPFGESAFVDASPGYTPKTASGGALQDVPLLPDRLVAAVSALRDNQDEQLSTLTRAGINNRYTLQVSGFNRSGSDYTLRVRSTALQGLGPCAVTPPTVSYPSNLPTFYAPVGQTVTGFAPGDDSVVLVNGSRLDAYYPGQAATVLQAAYNFTHSSGGVHGQVLQLDSSSLVNGALQALDASPCDVNKSNDVVRQINSFVFGLLPPQIRYVTILGGHAIVPHALLIDTTRDGNEREEAGDLRLAGNNPLSNAFGLGRFASDTPFGTPRPLLVGGQVVYVPTLAVGRVGESALSIAAQLDQFRSLSGVADPPDASRSATVTDYDFLAAGGTAVATALGTDYAVDHSLSGVNATWNRSQLDSKWLSRSPAPPSVGVLNMHYDQYRALPAFGNATNDQTDLYTAAQVAAGPALTQRIVLTVGCHSALDVPDGWLPSGTDPDVVLQAQDWAQRYGEKGLAVMIGNLGFGYADTNAVAYSALEQQLLAEAMSAHFDMGTALVQAQQNYLRRLVSLSPYDLKSLQQMVLWGPPQYRTTAAPAALPPAPPTGTLTTDAATGKLSYALTLTPQLRTVDDGGSTHVEARDSSTAPWQTASVSGHPVLPLTTAQAPVQSGLTVLSAVPTGLSTSGDSATTVTFAAAGTDTGAPQQPTSAGDFPSTLGHAWTVPNGTQEATTLAVTPAQIHLDGTAPGHAVVRQVTSASYLLRYGTPGQTPKPDTLVAISASHVPQSGTSSALTSWAVDVQPAAGAHTVQVYALSRPQSGSGAWVRADLTSSDGLRWTGSKTGYLGEYIIVAVNDLGFGAVSTLKGNATPGDLSALHVEGTQGENGWYTSATTVTTDSGTIYDNGAPVGSSVTLTNGTHQLSLLQANGKFVSSNGQTSYLFVNVDTVVPTVVITLANNPTTYPTDNNQPHPVVGSSQSYTASATYGPSGPGGPLTVNGQTLVGNGGTLDTSTVGQRSLVVSATSLGGLTGTATKDFRVVYKSASFVSPVQSTNTVVPLFSYQYTFRMFDSNDNQVTTAPAGTSFANTFTNAASCAPPGSINLPSGSGGSAPSYDATNRRWQWSLTKSGTQCQQLTFQLNDGWTKITTSVVTV